MRKLIYLDTAIDAVLKESNMDDAYGYMDTEDIVDLLNNLPSAQPERTKYIPDTKAVRSKRDCVDLAERVVATFYNQENEEWTQQTVTIADVLDSVCDEYTILPSAQPEIIRCKDCKYGEQDDIGRWFCNDLGCQIGSEDGSGYCANAERKTDD